MDKADAGDELFVQGRGVLQGDPLSPILFNIAIDYVLGGLSNNIGVEYGGEKVGALAYAEDVVF